MRCLALGQALKAKDCDVTFIAVCESNSLHQRLLKEGFHVIPLEQTYPYPIDWQVTSSVLKTLPGAWVVLDGYHLDTVYQRRINESGHQILLIDDTAHLDYYFADILLNQNINAEDLNYSCAPNTRQLLGPQYVLLRSEFLAWKNRRRQIAETARRVLVTLGGGDPENVTLQVINALKMINIPDLEVIIVAGVSNPHTEVLKEALFSAPCAMSIAHNVENMPHLMDWADLAVSAGGSTCWEIAFTGLPAITLVLAQNQLEIAKRLEVYGVTLNMGWHTSLREADLAFRLKELIYNKAKRFQMSQLGRRLVDGHGSARVAAILMNAI
jgi:UDP-2,4-diacetamido-2,4,6-trideoxy-beta-L-altropyranose hydrolase